MSTDLFLLQTFGGTDHSRFSRALQKTAFKRILNNTVLCNYIALFAYLMYFPNLLINRSLTKDLFTENYRKNSCLLSRSSKVGIRYAGNVCVYIDVHEYTHTQACRPTYIYMYFIHTCLAQWNLRTGKKQHEWDLWVHYSFLSTQIFRNYSRKVPEMWNLCTQYTYSQWDLDD